MPESYILRELGALSIARLLPCSAPEFANEEEETMDKVALRAGLEYLRLRLTDDGRVVNDAPLLFEAKYEVVTCDGFWEVTARRYFPLLGWQRIGRAHIRPHEGRVWISAH